MGKRLNTRGVHRSLVFDVHIRLELIACTDVEVANAVVQADNRRNAPTFLIAVERHIGSLLRKTGHGLSTCLCFLGACGILCGHCLILCFQGCVCGSICEHCILLCSVCGLLCLCGQFGRLVRKIRAKRNHIAAHTCADVFQITFVVVAGKVHACAEVHGQTVLGCALVFKEFIGNADLHAINILAAVHIHFSGIGIGGNAFCGKHIGDYRNWGFKHRQAFVERGLAAAARDAEVHGSGKLAFLISHVERGNERRGSLALKGLRGVAELVDVLCKGGKGRSDLAGLRGILPVEHEVPALANPCQAGRVAVRAVELEGSEACGVAQVGSILVRVCEVAAGIR